MAFAPARTKSKNEALAAPKFNVVAVHHLLCPDRSLLIAIANEGPETYEVSIIAYDVGSYSAIAHDLGSGVSITELTVTESYRSPGGDV